MPSTISQLFPPCPGFTEQNVGDLSNKVYIVTGSTSGVGYELAGLLYSAHATVYLAARSTSKLHIAKTELENAHPSSKGRLEPLHLDVSNLSMIKQSAGDFLSKESRLDVLFNNAGVMMPPVGSRSEQGHDLEMATNCLGPYLFTKLLTPILNQTAKNSLPGTVRVVWVASMLDGGVAQVGITFNDESGAPEVLKDRMSSYMQTKVGNCYLATETAEKLRSQGVVSVSVHPGIMKTELQRHNSPMPPWLIGAVFKGPRHGAYTELFAGLSPDVKMEQTGRYIVPWGRFGDIPKHLAEGLKTPDQGGNGKARRFVDWCEKETSPFV